MANLASTPQTFTYADYKGWPETERWELIAGEAFNMCAAPSRRHQAIVLSIASALKAFLKGKPCRVYPAPFDVLLPAWPDQADDEVDTVVQPDISVFCDPSRLTDAGAKGAPTLVVEVLSPWTSKKDLNDKYNLYERVGVQEYWVVDPAGSMQAYSLEEGGTYGEGRIVVKKGAVVSTALEGFSLDLGELMEEVED